MVIMPKNQVTTLPESTRVKPLLNYLALLNNDLRTFKKEIFGPTVTARDLRVMRDNVGRIIDMLNEAGTKKA